MRPTTGSHKIVNEIYTWKRGWVQIHPTELRRIMARLDGYEFRGTTRVHLMRGGDYTVDEIRRWTEERKAAK